MENKVWHYIETFGLLKEGQEVGVAVSGGPDSMALLICLRSLSAVRGFRVSALHFDHGTRDGASLRDAEFVRSFCEDADIPLIHAAADVPALARERGIGLELAGRQAREEFFERTVRLGAADVIATAHHMDDNAESVLMHLIRGCGTAGLCGIHPKRGVLIRPFLAVTRREIEQYLEHTNTPYVTDASNEDTSYDRNFVRHELIPVIRDRLNPSLGAALFRLSKAAAEDENYLARQADEVFSDCIISRTEGDIVLNAERLCSLHPAIARRIVRRALSDIGRCTDVEQAHVQAVLDAAQSGRTGRKADLGGGLVAQTSYGTIRIGPPQAPEAFETPLRVPGRTVLPGGAALESEFVKKRGDDVEDGLCVYVDADRLPRGAVIRTRRPGDVLRPLGGPGTKKLKDHLIDRKVPRAQRDELLLLADGPNILWVIGDMLSQDAAVRENTKRICRLSCSRSTKSDPAPQAPIGGTGA